MTTGTKKRGMPWWGIVLIILFVGAGLTTCAVGFGSMFALGNDAAKKTDTLLEEWLANGMPAIDDPVYGPGWDQKQIDRLNLFIKRVGEVRSSEPTACTARSSVGTSTENGTFVTCQTRHNLGKIQSISTSIWKKADDGLTLYRYNYLVMDEELANKAFSDVALIERGLDPDNLPVGAAPLAEEETTGDSEAANQQPE